MIFSVCLCVAASTRFKSDPSPRYTLPVVGTVNLRLWPDRHWCVWHRSMQKRQLCLPNLKKSLSICFRNDLFIHFIYFYVLIKHMAFGRLPMQSPVSKRSRNAVVHACVHRTRTTPSYIFLTNDGRGRSPCTQPAKKKKTTKKKNKKTNKQNPTTSQRSPELLYLHVEGKRKVEAERAPGHKDCSRKNVLSPTNPPLQQGLAKHGDSNQMAVDKYFAEYHA